MPLTIGAFVLLGITVLLLPFQVYFITYISSESRNPAITNRNVGLTMITLYTILVYEILNSVNILLFVIIPNNKWDINTYVLITDICQYGITLIYFSRAYELYYHINWARESVNKLWKSQLLGPGGESPEHSTPITVSNTQLTFDMQDVYIKENSEWYIKYEKTFGNWKVVGSVLMLLYAILIFLLDIFPLFLGSINENLLSILHLIIYCIIFCVLLYFVHKVRQNNDIHRISDELLYVTITLGTCLILSRIILFDIIANNLPSNLSEFISSVLLLIGCALCLHISSFWVLKVTYVKSILLKIEKGYTKERIFKSSSKIHKIFICCSNINEAIEMKRIEKRQSLFSPKGLKPLKLMEVLSTKIGFEVFCDFLLQELSIENILFLIEVKQFKGSCRRQHFAIHQKRASQKLDKINSNTLGLELKNDISPYKTFKLSTTTKSKPDIFKSKDVNKVKWVPTNSILTSFTPYEYGLYIYEKYIKSGSNLQINVSGKTSAKLRQFWSQTRLEITSNDKYEETLFVLYDKAWESILSLMSKDTFSRFALTEEYLDLCQNHRPKRREFENNKIIAELKDTDSQVAKDLFSVNPSNMSDDTLAMMDTLREIEINNVELKESETEPESNGQNNMDMNADKFVELQTQQ